MIKNFKDDNAKRISLLGPCDGHSDGLPHSFAFASSFFTILRLLRLLLSFALCICITVLKMRQGSHGCFVGIPVAQVC